MYSEKNGIKFNVYGTDYFLKYATETPIGKGLVLIISNNIFIPSNSFPSETSLTCVCTYTHTWDFRLILFKETLI